MKTFSVLPLIATLAFSQSKARETPASSSAKLAVRLPPAGRHETHSGESGKPGGKVLKNRGPLLLKTDI
jgi:hypothetical protein